VALLRKVLTWQAVVWALAGLALAVAPGAVVEGLLDQPILTNGPWVRLLGVCSIVLAAQMTLVARKLDELWWWSWSFAILELGATLALLWHALAGVPDGWPSWPWWAGAIGSLAFLALDVTALAKAGTERSPV